MRKGEFLQIGIYGKEMDKTMKILQKIKPISIVIFNRDFDNVEELRQLIRTVKNVYIKEFKIEPPLISIDQEGGNVVRIRELDYPPSNYAIGSFGSNEFAYYAGAINASQLGEIGLDWNLAPVLDTLSNKDNQIIMERSFGESIEIVSNMGKFFIKGTQDFGIIATAKHFPGHGYVREDSHERLPVDTRSLNSIKNGMKPFLVAINTGVKSIMLSHINYPALDNDYPASMSKKILDILRKEIGYNGVILTDSLDMRAISSNYSVEELSKLAFSAGSDILECADPEMAETIFDNIQNIDPVDLASREERLISLYNRENKKYKPPREVMEWYSFQAPKWIRRKILDPSLPIILYPLKMAPLKVGSGDSWYLNSLQRISSILSELGIINKIFGVNNQENIRNEQIIFIGKNLNIWGGYEIIDKYSTSNNCVFLSMGVPADVGLVDEKVGYISSLGQKFESLIASIYAILGFYAVDTMDKI